LEKAKLMQLEIEEKRKLPKSVKENISTTIFQDLLVAIIIMAYFCIVNFSYYHFDGNVFEMYMKYFALGIIFLTVISFEIGYRKNSIKIAIIGTELLCCGILSLYIPYIFLHTTNALRISIMILPAFLIVYYALKSLFVYNQKKFEYQNNLSDVKEIVKDTEKISYLEEESKKTYREKTEIEKAFKENLRQEQKIRKARKDEEENRRLTNKKKRRKFK
jgi:hypothetical protein